VRHLWAWNRKHQVLAIAEATRAGMRLAFCNAQAKQNSSIWCASRRKYRDELEAAQHGHGGRGICQLMGRGGRTSARGSELQWCGTPWATCRWSAFSKVERSQGITYKATPGY